MTGCKKSIRQLPSSYFKSFQSREKENQLKNKLKQTVEINLRPNSSRVISFQDVAREFGNRKEKKKLINYRQSVLQSKRDENTVLQLTQWF